MKTYAVQKAGTTEVRTFIDLPSAVASVLANPPESGEIDFFVTESEQRVWRVSRPETFPDPAE